MRPPIIRKRPPSAPKTLGYATEYQEPYSSSVSSGGRVVRLGTNHPLLGSLNARSVSRPSSAQPFSRIRPVSASLARTLFVSGMPEPGASARPYSARPSRPSTAPVGGRVSGGAVDTNQAVREKYKDILFNMCVKGPTQQLPSTIRDKDAMIEQLKETAFFFYRESSHVFDQLTLARKQLAFAERDKNALQKEKEETKIGASGQNTSDAGLARYAMEDLRENVEGLDEEIRRFDLPRRPIVQLEDRVVGSPSRPSASDSGAIRSVSTGRESPVPQLNLSSALKDNQGLGTIEERSHDDDNDDESQATTRMSSSRTSVAEMVDLKFKKFEELVFVLKKRLVKFEKNIGMVQALETHESVADLVKYCKELEDSNKRLRLREVRFAHNALLKRRAFDYSDTFLMRYLISALQNELCYSDAILHEASMKKSGLTPEKADVGSTVEWVKETNLDKKRSGYRALMPAGVDSSMGADFDPPRHTTVYSSLGELQEIANELLAVQDNPMSRRHATAKREEGDDFEPGDILNDDTDEDEATSRREAASLRIELNNVRSGREKVQSRLDNATQELLLLRRVRELYERMTSDEPRHAKLNLLVSENAMLSSRIEDLLHQLDERDRTLELQEEITDGVMKVKAKALKKCMKLRETNEKLAKSGIALKKELSMQFGRFESLKVLSMSIVQALIDRRNQSVSLPAISKSFASSYLNASYLQSVSWHLTRNWAAIRIQAFVRGAITRRRLSKRLKLPVGRLRANQRVAKRAPVVVSIKDESFENLASLMGVAEVTLADKNAVHEFVTQLKVQVIEQLKGTVNQDLKQMASGQAELCGKIDRRLAKYVQRQVVGRSSQTTGDDTADSAIQTEVFEEEKKPVGRQRPQSGARKAR